MRFWRVSTLSTKGEPKISIVWVPWLGLFLSTFWGGWRETTGTSPKDHHILVRSAKTLPATRCSRLLEKFKHFVYRWAGYLDCLGLKRFVSLLSCSFFFKYSAKWVCCFEGVYLGLKGNRKRTSPFLGNLELEKAVAY